MRIITTLFLLSIFGSANATQVKINISGFIESAINTEIINELFSAEVIYETDTSLAEEIFSFSLLESDSNIIYSFDGSPFGISLLVGNPINPVFNSQLTDINVGLIDNIPAGGGEFTDNVGIVAITEGAFFEDNGLVQNGGFISLVFINSPDFLLDTNTIPIFTSLDEANEVLLLVDPGGISGRVTDLNVSIIPIPATVWLFGSALFGLIGLKKFRIK